MSAGFWIDYTLNHTPFFSSSYANYPLIFGPSDPPVILTHLDLLCLMNVLQVLHLSYNYKDLLLYIFMRISFRICVSPILRQHFFSNENKC